VRWRPASGCPSGSGTGRVRTSAPPPTSATACSGEEPEEHETPAVPTAEPRAPKEIDQVPLAPETAPEPRANDAATTEDDREPAPWDRGPSPFTPTPVPAAEPVTDDEDPRLAAYNRMLAQLAARDQES
jgi:hypothetical protein